jgi:LysM repeat protein
MKQPLFTMTSSPQSKLALVLMVTLTASALMTSGVSHAQHARYTTTPAQKAQAQAVADSQGIPETDLLATAPERYTVKKHDTLWGVSKLYLKSPWQWPSLWGMNKTQIANPHLIYPGQVLVLTRANGRAKLGLAEGADGLAEEKMLPEDRLSPRVRSEPLLPDAIKSIHLGSMRSFLSQPLIVDEAGLKNSGYVLTGLENRVFTAQNDSFYARNLPESSEGRYQLYRPGKPLRDPDTGLVIAYEAHYVGDAELQRAGDPAKLKMTVAKEELTHGDRITTRVPEPSTNAVPHAPDAPIKARVMSSYNGVQYAGGNMIVSINKGRSSQVEIGHVLSLWHTGSTVLDKEATPEPKGFWDKFKNRTPSVRLPDEEYGQAIVFRVFENVSYALVVGTTLPVEVGDTLTQP